jgi:hypothetical protein
VKLLFCLECQDVIRIFPKEIRQCRCGKVRGGYLDDGLNAEYSGESAVPLAFLNSSFGKAVAYRPQKGEGLRFEAFVVPVKCDSFIKKEKL